ncbi:ataxin-7-like protein 2b isoform X2 [Thalassophryne amazonica]|nr:ataxin-7-like protein 2b isoform X2 [Thalassophryne amazonica]
MTLRKEDMPIYGHCPAYDDFYLVVCSHCGQVVKPQAFENHCERRHGSLTKMCGKSSTSAPQQRPRPGRPAPSLSSSFTRERRHESGAPLAALPVHQHRPIKAQKEAVSLSSAEKFPQENPHLPHSSSTPRPRISLWQSGPLPPGDCSTSSASSASSPSERPSVQKPTAGHFSESASPVRSTKTYSRSYKNSNKKECDLNKHSGVVDPERKKQCTGQLICNTEPIHQQQSALSRSKTFDQLAREPRSSSAGGEQDQHCVKLKIAEPSLEAFEKKSATPSSKYNIHSNCNILRSSDPTESLPEDNNSHTVEMDVHPPYPFNQSLLSSEESEDEEEEDSADLPATPWHPKPLGLCTFGCRLLGCSIFTFDRRLHHLRVALSAMVENHISTHVWKKLPQVSTNLRSHHVTPAAGSPVRTGARISQPTGSLSLESTPLEQFEPTNSQHKSHSTKVLPPTSYASFGRLSKMHVKEMELTRDSRAKKATRLFPSDEDCVSRYAGDRTLHAKDQPHLPSPQTPVNGAFSSGKKPLQPTDRDSASSLYSLEKCSPLPAHHHLAHSSPQSKGRSSGIQRKAVGCDSRDLLQKRKSSSESLLHHTSPSRTSKVQRSSSPPRSIRPSWKGVGIREVLACSLEKSSDP